MRAALREKIIRIAYQNLIKHQNKFSYEKRKKSFHYSFITLRSNILHWSINLENKSHPKAHLYDYYGARQHAEFRVVTTFPHPTNILNRCDLWNIRINRNGNIAMSAPCDKCEDFISNFNFRHIFFTNEVGLWTCL